jgi:alpha-glucuronidase
VQLLENVFRFDQRMQSRRRMWTKMPTDQFRSIDASEECRLTCAALRQPFDAERCVQGDNRGKIRGKTTAAKVREFAAEKRNEVRKPGLKERIDA